MAIPSFDIVLSNILYLFLILQRGAVTCLVGGLAVTGAGAGAAVELPLDHLLAACRAAASSSGGDDMAGVVPEDGKPVQGSRECWPSQERALAGSAPGEEKVQVAQDLLHLRCFLKCFFHFSQRMPPLLPFLRFTKEGDITEEEVWKRDKWWAMVGKRFSPCRKWNSGGIWAGGGGTPYANLLPDMTASTGYMEDWPKRSTSNEFVMGGGAQPRAQS